MKKRILAMFLAAVTACSVCACGSAGNKGNDYEKYEVLFKYLENENYEQAYKELERIEERNAAAKENEEGKDKETEGDPSVIDFSKLERDEEGYVKLTEAQFAGLLEKVEITEDNWKEYFEDYERTEHYETVNSFGEVESESDWVYYVFGLKEEYFAALNGVAFKFSGKKILGYNIWNQETEEAVPGYWELLPNESMAKGYDLEGNFLAEDNLIYYGYEEPQEYFVAELGTGRETNGFYTDYECLAVTGEMILIHLPDEIKEDNGIMIVDEEGNWRGSFGLTWEPDYEMISEFVQ